MRNTTGATRKIAEARFLLDRLREQVAKVIPKDSLAERAYMNGCLSATQAALNRLKKDVGPELQRAESAWFGRLPDIERKRQRKRYER